MKRFDYSEMKLDLVKDAKSQQERAQEQLAAERKVDQDAVDAVSYGVDRSNFRSSYDNEAPKKKNPLDTHDHAVNGSDIDAQVKTTPPPAAKPEKATPPPAKVASVVRNKNKYSDDDIEDFEESFSKSGDDDDVIIEETDDGGDEGRFVPNVRQNPPVDDYDDDGEDSEPEYEDDGESSYDEDDGFEDDYAEQERIRREKEAKLRERTSQANAKNRPKPAKQTPSKGKTVSEDEIQYAYLRKVPKELVQRIKAQFPTAATMDEAVAAYLFLKEGKPNDVTVTERIRSVAANYVGEEISAKDAQDEILKAITQLTLQLRTLSKKSNAIELAAVYMLFDYIGFRKKDQISPSDVDFLEKGINEFITNLEKSAEVKAMKDRNRAGSLQIRPN